MKITEYATYPHDDDGMMSAQNNCLCFITVYAFMYGRAEQTVDYESE